MCGVIAVELIVAVMLFGAVWFLTSRLASVIAMYNPFHEMDIRQFFGEMNKRILSVRPDTNLKRLRISAGFSQDDLARLSGVPARMIQQEIIERHRLK